MFTKAMSGLAACGLLLAAQTASAGHDHWGPGKHRGHRDTDYARVIDVDPIVRQVRVSVPRRECWMETRYEEIEHPATVRTHGAAGSMILGGIIGAAVGNQIGSGDGRRAATVAGAIIGSAIGHDVAERRAARAQPAAYYTETRPYEVERCKVSYHEEYEERIEGYRVTYEYNGRRYTTRLPYDPGDRIRVSVDVRPDDC